MIDASTADLRDPIDRNRSGSNASSIMSESIRGSRTSLNRTSPSGIGLRAIETSFCGPKPIHSGQSFEMAGAGVTVAAGGAAGSSVVSSAVSTPLGRMATDIAATASPCLTAKSPGGMGGHEDNISLTESETDDRNLVEEIKHRTQFPLTKQDSYANAIYSSASKRGRNVKKQSSYESAVESGLYKQQVMRRTKQILKIRKQPSYTRAIGGSFEDEHEDISQRGGRIRKQESYLKAVGELSPESEQSQQLDQYSNEGSPYRYVILKFYERGFLRRRHFSFFRRIRKQDSYLRAIHQEDDLTPLPVQVRIRKQDSYMRAIHGLSFDDNNKGATTTTTTTSSSSTTASAAASSSFSPSSIRRFKKQDSYSRAIEGGSYSIDNTEDQENTPRYKRPKFSVSGSKSSSIESAGSRYRFVIKHSQNKNGQDIFFPFSDTISIPIR